MLRIFGQTVLGLLLLLGGLYLIFIGLSGINDGYAWFLLLALPLVGVGVLLLFRAGKAEDTVVLKAKTDLSNLAGSPSTEDKEGLADKIQENNQLESQWAKTEEARNRLRMLELSAPAGKTEK